MEFEAFENVTSRQTRLFPLLILSFLAWATLIAMPTAFAQSTPTPATATPSMTPSPAATAISVYATVYQTTNLRTGPDTRFDIVTQLGRGDRVQVIGRDAPSATALTPTANGWLFVVTEDSQSGWVPIFSVELEDGARVNNIPIYEVDPESVASSTPGADAEVRVIAYGRVNVRSGPAISYEIIGQLDVDDSAIASARSSSMNDWLLIEWNALEGWVAYFTVRVSGDPSVLPILVPDSTGGALVAPSRVIRALFNVRLHTEATLDSPTVVVAPFDSRVTVLARSEDNIWLYVDYEGSAGWGVAELFSPLGDLASVPVFDPEAAQPVENTLEPDSIEPDSTAEATPAL